MRHGCVDDRCEGRRLGVLLAKDRQDFQILPNFLLSSFNSLSWVGWEGETRAAPSRYPKCHCQIARLGSLARRAAVVAPATHTNRRRPIEQAFSVPSSKSSGQLRPIIKNPIHSCVCVCVCPCPGPSYPPSPPSPWPGHSRRALAADSRLDDPTARGYSNQVPASNISFPEPQHTLPPSPGHTPAHPPNISHLWVNELQQTLVPLPRYAVPFQCLIFDFKFEPRASSPSPVRPRQDGAPHDRPTNPLVSAPNRHGRRRLRLEGDTEACDREARESNRSILRLRSIQHLPSPSTTPPSHAGPHGRPRRGIAQSRISSRCVSATSLR